MIFFYKLVLESLELGFKVSDDIFCYRWRGSAHKRCRRDIRGKIFFMATNDISLCFGLFEVIVFNFHLMDEFM